MDIENNMLIEPIVKKKKFYCYCDYCGEPIYEGEPITKLFDCDVVTHQECFCDFINENKHDCYAQDF